MFVTIFVISVRIEGRKYIWVMKRMKADEKRGQGDHQREQEDPRRFREVPRYTQLCEGKSPDPRRRSEGASRNGARITTIKPAPRGVVTDSL